MDRHDIVRQVAIRQAELGINDSELAGRIGITPATYSQQKRTGYKRMETLSRVAQALGCELQIKLVPKG